MKYYLVLFKTGEFDSIVSINSYDTEEARQEYINYMEKQWKLPYGAQYYTTHEEVY